MKGYYLLTMEKASFQHVREYHLWQLYRDKANQPGMPLHNLTSPWPFSMWGMVAIDIINTKSIQWPPFYFCRYRLFTKWVEAAFFANLTKTQATRFVRNNFICWYGLPQAIMIDNARNLNNDMIKDLCTQLMITHRNSAPYRPQNDAVEAASKNIKKTLVRWQLRIKIGIINFHSLCMPIELRFIHQRAPCCSS